MSASVSPSWRSSRTPASARGVSRPSATRAITRWPCGPQASAGGTAIQAASTQSDRPSSRFMSGGRSFDGDRVLDLGEFALLDPLDLHDVLDRVERTGVDDRLRPDGADAEQGVE